MIGCRILNKPVHYAAAIAHHARHIRRTRRALVIVCVVIGGIGIGIAASAPFFYSPPHSPGGESWGASPSARGSLSPPIATGTPTTAVPEPSSLALLAIGIAGFAIWRLR